MYLDPLIKKLEDNADPGLAAGMKKYMRDQFDCYGIPSPARKEIFRSFISEYGLPGANDLIVVTNILWNKKERECQYFALNILEKFMKRAPEESIDLYEDLILRKSWWDTVDFIAPVLVGKHFILFPHLTGPYTEKWMNSQNIWLQRSCLLFQLKYKMELNTELLNSYILRLTQSKEFFIRKAIGWILREYSKVNPGWVKEYIKNTPMAPLSAKEGLKRINRK